MQDEQIRDSWDANAEAWTQVVREGQIASRRLATDAAIVAALRRQGVRQVLDVGCGEGWLARALAAEGVAVTGFDASAGLIERAQALGGGAFFVLSYEAAAAAPERLGGPYDGIACNFALLGEDLAPLLSALRDRLAPRGCLVIQTVHPFTACGDAPYADGWRTETFDGFGARFPSPMPWYFRTVASWLDVLAAAGLCVDACEEPLHPETGRPLSLLLVCRRG